MQGDRPSGGSRRVRYNPQHHYIYRRKQYANCKWDGAGMARATTPSRWATFKQIPGVSTIVWALHDKMPGEVWEVDEIKKVVDQIESYGFNADVV